MNIFRKHGKSEMTLEELSKYLVELRIPTGLVFTPTNLKSEKKKFFASDQYEPQFEYRVVRNKNSEIFRQLGSLKRISDIDPRISDFYIELIDAKKSSSDMMHAVGNNDLISQISLDKYRKPSPKLFRNSCRVLRGKLDAYNVKDSKKVDRGDKLGYEEISKVFDLVFEYLKLSDWEVAPSKNISKNGVKVGIKRKQIYVDPNIEKSSFKIKKTLVHEVGTHVLRSYNGFKSGFDALGNANIPSYLDVEEGLATWNEENAGLLTDKWLKNKAGLVWAIYTAEDMTFRELYNSLSATFLPYTAWDIAYRVKRGLGDTSYPGIYAKDVVYFRGFRKMKRVLSKDPSMYEKLYAGKIGISQTKWVDDGLIPKPKIVPSKEMWNEIFKELSI